MNAKAIIPLIAGLGIAGLGGKLGFDYIRKAQGATPKLVQFWAPIADVPRGTAIDETMLQPVGFPAAIAPKDAITDKAKLIGRVPHTGAPAGLPILESMLFPAGTMPGLHVPAGLRAIAVKIDESSGVDYHLQPGCHVDVVGYFTTRRNNKSETLARTLVEDVEVAAVGARIAPTAPEREDPNAKKKKAPEKARAVTLLVKPEQAPVLHLAEQKGKIKLSLRGDNDDAMAVSDARTSEAEVLGEPTEPTEHEGLAELVKGFFGSDDEKAQEEPAPVATLTPPEPPAPVYAHVMVLYNGTDRRVLGWEAGKSMDPVELTSGGPNIFKDPPAPPAGQPPIGIQQPVAPPGVIPTPPGQPELIEPPSDDDQTNESEPEELFG